MSKIWLPGGGGGADLDVITAGAGDVLAGKVIVDQDGEPLTGTLALTGTAADSQVLNDQTYYNTDAKTKRTGTMANNGAQNAALNCGQSKDIPAGFTTGGKVTANSLASQTGANAAAGDILTGKNAWVNGAKVAGTMPNRGAVSQALSAGGSYTIPEGCHNGAGKVTANSLASQTPGTAAASQILSGQTAWVNGSKVTGNMANRGAYGGAGNSRGNDTGNARMWVRVPGGYYSENANVYLSWADIRSMAGVTADKIKKGQSIMGIIGSWEGFVKAPLILIQDSEPYWPNSQTPGTSLVYSKWNSSNCQYIMIDEIGYVDFSVHTGKDNAGGGFMICRTNETIDLTNYNYIKSYLDYLSSGYSIVTTGYVGVSKNNNLQTLTFDAVATQASDPSPTGTLITNISSLTGRYFIYFAINLTRNYGSNADYNGGMRIKSVQLTTV